MIANIGGSASSPRAATMIGMPIRTVLPYDELRPSIAAFASGKRSRRATAKAKAKIDRAAAK